MIIYGAGMSGLLAANMLHKLKPVVHEAATALPDNHGALLRFRSDAVSKATGIDFKKVWVQKAVLGLDGVLTTNPSVQLQNMYSLKVTKKAAGRSIMNLAPGERFIAPDNFIAELAKDVNIVYDSPLYNLQKAEPSISTIPMDAMMRLSGWENVPDFEFQSIWTITADIITPVTELYQTIYVPDPHDDAYRVSITGDKIIVELINCPYAIPLVLEEDREAAEDELCRYLSLFFGKQQPLAFNNVKLKHQKYGKLLPLQDNVRKEFILALTDLYNIYSLGRFGTWRQILMDDVVKDVRIIESMVSNRDAYSKRLHIA